MSPTSEPKTARFVALSRRFAERLLVLGMADIGRAEKWFCCLAILFGVFLRLDRFWEPSLWLDELSTAWIATSDGWPTLWHRSLMALQPPLYFAIVKLFLVFGRNEFFLRLPSVIFGLASIGALMMTVRWVAGARAALYFGAVYALTNRAIYHSVEARNYTLVLLETSVSIFFFIASLQRGGRWIRAGYAVSTLLVAYTHLIYSCVLFGQVVVAACYYFFDKKRSGALRLLLRTQVILLLLLTPLFPLFLSIVRNARAGMDSFISRPNLDYWRSLVTHPELGVALVLVLLSLPRMWSRRRQLRGWSAVEKSFLGLGIAYVAIFPAAVLSASVGGPKILEPRYLLLPLLGAIMVVVPVMVRMEDRSLRVALNTYLAVLIGLQFIYWHYVGVRVGNRDWRQAITWVQEHYRPGDVLLLRSGLIEAKYLSLEDPGAQEYLALPLCGFYDHGGMTVFNLPWHTDQLYSARLTPPAVQERVQGAPQIFFLVARLPSGSWDWRLQEKWVQRPGEPPPTKIEEHVFDSLQVRVYRMATRITGS